MRSRAHQLCPTFFPAQPFTLLCTRKQYAPVVLKLPDWPPVLMSEQLPPPPELELELELELLELLLEDEELLPPPDTSPKPI